MYEKQNTQNEDREGAPTNALLVDNLYQAGIIRSPLISSAMKAVDRGNYAIEYPYQDTPSSIGFGQTISAPHMHGHAVQSLLPALTGSDAHILDVGCGSGYLLAVFARLNPEATVYGIDSIPGLVNFSRKNLLKEDEDLLLSGRVKVDFANGWDGFSTGAPYDAIHVGAGAESLPKALLQQLKVKGRMVIPVGSEHHQELLQIDRVSDDNPEGLNDFLVTDLMSVRYVPLTKPIHKKQL